MTFPEKSEAQTADAFMAWRRGEPIDFWNGEQWCMVMLEEASLNRTIFYRKRPRPALRRWLPSEVPVGAIVRQKLNPDSRVMITACIDGKIYAGKFSITESDWAVNWAIEKTEYSMDLGKTWSPCGAIDF